MHTSPSRVNSLSALSAFSALTVAAAHTKIAAAVTAAVKRLTAFDLVGELGSAGRIIVRESGTEPLIRVMTEGENEEQILRIADELADVVRKNLC